MARSDWPDEAGAGLVSLVPLFGPVLADPVRRGVGKFRDEIARNQSKAIRAAQAVSGMKREDLAERIALSPDLVPLAARVLYAAGMTNQDEILDALGAALGAAVHDPGRAEEVDLILMGLQDLRRRHIELLRLLTEPPKWIEPDSPTLVDVEAERRALAEAGEHIQSEIAGWNVDALARVSRFDSDEAFTLVTGLTRAGFARSRSGLNALGYRPTRLGLALLDVLAHYEASR